MSKHLSCWVCRVGRRMQRVMQNLYLVSRAQMMSGS